MATIKFFSGGNLPLEMHKVRIVQKLTLPPIGYRLKAMNEAGNNMFLLQNADVFMDMLTDSGANAVSDHQLAAMMVPDCISGQLTFLSPTNRKASAHEEGRPPFLMGGARSRPG